MQAFILLGLQLLPQLISAGKDIASLIGLMRKVAGSDAPTQADWDALHAIEDGLRSRLHSDDR